MHTGYEKRWTSDELCALIPDVPKNDPSSDSSIRLILRIVGGVVVLGAIVGVIIFRRRKMASQQQYQRFDNQQRSVNH
jgi:hypothetical protein